MSSFEHNLGVKRRSNAGQWAAGALRSLATIAVSALVVWIAVSAINETGLLRPAPAEPHSPAGGSPFPQIAYG
jgi:hypothetical protein